MTISVAPDYKHIRKLLTASEPLAVPGLDLKWYGLHAEDLLIPDEVSQEARHTVTAELGAGSISPTGELGFVILHRVGPNYLLLVCTWRNENELWETVYFMSGGAFELVPMDDTHKATYCVWEMGAVMHEQQAWITYLFSDRDSAAKRAYLADVRPTSLI